MSHKLSHIITRSGSFLYKRRVPDRVAKAFGRTAIRVNLGRDYSEAETLSEGLTRSLDELWSVQDVHPVAIEALLNRIRPRELDLVLCSEEYLALKNIVEKPTRVAVQNLISICGNKDIRTYSRSDARRLTQQLLERGNKTATVRRRIQSRHAIFEFGLLEMEAEKRNPSSKLPIPKEGEDKKRRGTFTLALLQRLYREALTSGKDTRQIFPVLGETGESLAEIVGLRWEVVCLKEEKILIAPHSTRRLKTRN